MPKLPKKGWKTHAIGIALVVLGAASGVDWSAFFDRETVAAIGAGVVLGRAIVALFQARGL